MQLVDTSFCRNNCKPIKQLVCVNKHQTLPHHAKCTICTHTKLSECRCNRGDHWLWKKMKNTQTLLCTTNRVWGLNAEDHIVTIYMHKYTAIHIFSCCSSSVHPNYIYYSTVSLYGANALCLVSILRFTSLEWNMQEHSLSLHYYLEAWNPIHCALLGDNKCIHYLYCTKC